MGGQDKARLTGADALPLLRRTLDALRAAGATHLLVAAGDDPQRLSDLDLGPSVRLLPDAPPGHGPLGGLAAVLAAAEHPWVLVVATDMPSLDPALLRELLVAAQEHGPPALIPKVEGTLQPLHAAWHTDTLPAIEAALAAKHLALHRLARDLGADTPTYPASDSYRSVNTPEDLEAL